GGAGGDVQVSCLPADARTISLELTVRICPTPSVNFCDPSVPSVVKTFRFIPAHANSGFGGRGRPQRQSTQKSVLAISPKRRGCRLPGRSRLLDLHVHRRGFVRFFVAAG